MELLKDKQTKNYDNISRYASFSFSYNKADKKYIYEITSQLNDSTPYVLVKVNQNDTLDYLSNKYYGRPDYYWIIADFNRINDPFIDLYKHFKTIKIPSITNISFKNN